MSIKEKLFGGRKPAAHALEKPSETTIPIMHCFDNNYVIPAAVSFYSMLQNANKNYNYVLYVLHTDITEKNQRKLHDLVARFPNASLEFINMDHRFNDIWDSLVNKGHYSKEVLYKILTPSIFPNLDKLVITDVDVVFLGDISESYFSIDPDDDKIYLSGIKNVLPKSGWLADYYKNYDTFFWEGAVSELKICGGYLVMNLKSLRKNNMEKTFVDYLRDNSARLLQSEQDVLNFCLKEENVKHLPLDYLVCSYCYDIFNTKEMCKNDRNYSAKELTRAMKSPIQLHYATGQKPWNDFSTAMAEIWFLYLEKSGFMNDYIRKKYADMYKDNTTPEVPKHFYGIINN